MKRDHALFAALLALSLNFPASADEKNDKPKSEPAKVPFDILKSRHMTVQVKVNGKGPYRLVFDTGAPMTLISTKIARDAGLIKKEAPTPSLFGGIQKHKLKEFQIGELKTTDASVIVMDHPTVKMMAEIFGPIEGIVGFPFFARYRMTIDYQAKEMTLEPVDYNPTDYLDLMMKMLMNPPKDRGGPVVLAPAAAWGFTADKGTQDEEPGLDVRQVLAGSAAAKAGLKVGDRLLTVDGRWTDTVVDLFEAATHIKPGSTVPVTVLRDGKEITLNVTPAKGL